MVKAIKQGAYTSKHTLSQFLLYFIFCITLLFSNVGPKPMIEHKPSPEPEPEPGPGPEPEPEPGP